MTSLYHFQEWHYVSWKINLASDKKKKLETNFCQTVSDFKFVNIHLRLSTWCRDIKKNKKNKNKNKKKTKKKNNAWCSGAFLCRAGSRGLWIWIWKIMVKWIKQNFLFHVSKVAEIIFHFSMSAYKQKFLLKFTL